MHHVYSWMSYKKTNYIEAHIDMDEIPLSEVTIVYKVNECCDMNIFKIKK
jgi:hypothetical protein